MNGQKPVLILAIVLLGCALSCTQQPQPAPDSAAQVSSADDAATAVQEAAIPPELQVPEEEVETIYERRQEDSEKYWSDEVRAQHYEQTVVKHWDQMLQPEDDKFAAFAAWPFDSIQLGEAGPPEELEYGIQYRRLEGGGPALTHAEWVDFLGDMQSQGYRIEDVEFHQSRYIPRESQDGQDKSVFSNLLHVVNEDRSKRWLLKGDVEMTWSDETDEQGRNLVASARIVSCNIWEREGEQYFDKVLAINDLDGLGPVICYDLDGDGLSEILSPTHDIILRNQGDGTLKQEALFAELGEDAPKNVETGLIADMNGDGYPDLLCTAQHPDLAYRHTLYLLEGGAEGVFRSKPTPIHDLGLAISEPCALTAGDIDGDNDLDVWLAQYKVPYIHGQMPSPFYDANDGFPAFLFVNMGNGKFEERTEAAGLGAKRYRRTYSSSFADLDDDNDLDLLVVSDFSGIDIYLNDGAGNFRDATEDLVDQRHNFGMGHTFADFNADGALDFYVTGMGSTTMRRLNDLGLARDDRPEMVEMRTVMGYGNRMYIRGAGNGYAQPEYRDAISRTGWAWGVVALDFDNDADKDIYVVNGHASGKSTKDYCSTYWCHDIYEGNSRPDMALGKFFTETLSSNLGKTMSWDGYQKNQLLMNRDGKDFLNIAFMMDLAFVEDTRSAVADDIDADGRPDLIMTSINWNYDTPGAPEQKISLRVIHSNFPIHGNHWVGVRLRENSGAPSPIGAEVVVRAGGKTQKGIIATGDSWRSQNAPACHFGLGKAPAIDYIEIIWPNGHVQRVDAPAVNTYHPVTYDGAPAGTKVARS